MFSYGDVHLRNNLFSDFNHRIFDEFIFHFPNASISFYRYLFHLICSFLFILFYFIKFLAAKLIVIPYFCFISHSAARTKWVKRPAMRNISPESKGRNKIFWRFQNDFRCFRGATCSKLVLMGEDGKELCWTEAGGTNFFLEGMDVCHRRIVDLVTEAKRKAGLPQALRLNGLVCKLHKKFRLYFLSGDSQSWSEVFFQKFCFV